MLTAHAIKYTDEYPCLPFPFDSLPEKEFNQICATTKARGRSYEGEYRLLIAVGHSGPKDPNVNGDFVTLPEDSVIGVTAGAKMEPNNVSQLLAVAKAHKLPMWQAKIDNREFRLRFHRIL
jgi:hypothetical protein